MPYLIATSTPYLTIKISILRLSCMWIQADQDWMLPKPRSSMPTSYLGTHVPAWAPALQEVIDILLDLLASLVLQDECRWILSLYPSYWIKSHCRQQHKSFLRPIPRWTKKVSVQADNEIKLDSKILEWMCKLLFWCCLLVQALDLD